MSCHLNAIAFYFRFYYSKVFDTGCQLPLNHEMINLNAIQM